MVNDRRDIAYMSQNGNIAASHTHIAVIDFGHVSLHVCSQVDVVDRVGKACRIESQILNIQLRFISFIEFFQAFLRVFQINNVMKLHGKLDISA
ncbi:hypothetical protein D3C86_1146910 [compost metagenome]